MLEWIIFIVFLVGIYQFGQLIVGNKLKFCTLDRIVINPIVGFVVYTLTLYIFSLLHIRVWAPYLLALLAILVLIRKRPKLYPTFHFVRYLHIYWPILLIILIGAACQLFIVAPNGLQSLSGYRFYGANAHDGLWHMSLIQLLASTFPPPTPSYAPELLKGYHYFVDFFASELLRLTNLSVSTLLFQLLPLLFSVHMGLASLAFIRRLTKDKFAQIITIFLIYFAGSLGFIELLLHKVTGSGETAFWAQQSLTTFINLPLGISFSVLLITLILLFDCFKQKNGIYPWFIAAILVGSQIAIKSYGGVLILISFTVISVIQSISRKNFLYLGSGIFAIGVAALLSLLTIGKSTNLFVFSPGGMLKLMMESPDRLNLPNWETMRQSFQLNSNYIGLFILWFAAGVLFILGNFSVRLIGIFAIKRMWLKSKLTTLFMVMIIILGIFIPILYLQKGTSWNTIQFMYYALFLMNLLAGFSLSLLNQRVKKVIISLLVLVSLASSIPIFNYYRIMYAKSQNMMTISNQEFEALESLKRLPSNSIVLSGYDETAYITALSGKTTYFSDATQADILLLPTQERSLELSRLFVWCKHPSEIRAFMNDNDISIIYVNKITYPNCVDVFNRLDFVKLLYANAEVELFQRNF